VGVPDGSGGAQHFLAQAQSGEFAVGDPGEQALFRGGRGSSLLQVGGQAFQPFVVPDLHSAGEPVDVCALFVGPVVGGVVVHDFEQDVVVAARGRQDHTPVEVVHLEGEDVAATASLGRFEVEALVGFQFGGGEQAELFHGEPDVLAYRLRQPVVLTAFEELPAQEELWHGGRSPSGWCESGRSGRGSASAVSQSVQEFGDLKGVGGAGAVGHTQVRVQRP